ncbi:MAG: sigma-70 family RNA polymerase sigma factor [Saprospiraceae bacterium]|nr:sigma-70 family RNA polymerase sigma factor [Saprospiraceae bacterium]
MLVAIESDQELILQYLNGDEKSFETLLNRHKNKIYTSIYLFVKDRDLADDMFQEVFIKIIDTIRKGRYNHEGKFSQWAMRIAYNLCVDQFRRNKRVPTLTPTDEFDVMDIVPADEKNMEEEIIMSQTHSKLRKYVDSLPFEQREVVILRHFADLSFKEISQLTRVSINTSLGRMRYALIHLRKMMEGVEAGFN